MFYSDKNKKTKLTKITSTKSRINNFIFVSVLMLGPQLHSTTDNSLAKQLENYHQFNWTLLLKHQEELSEIKTINLCYNWLCEPQEEMWVAPELCPSMGIWPALKEKLQLCKNLEKLNLSLNGLFQLSPSGWINIIKSAEQWTKLKKLNLKGNTLSRLDDNGWEFIEALLITCRNLDHLNLGNNALYELSPEKWHFIGNILKNCDNLTRLKLGDNHLEKLDAKGWLNISNALKKIPNLKYFSYTV